MRFSSAVAIAASVLLSGMKQDREGVESLYIVDDDKSIPTRNLTSLVIRRTRVITSSRDE